MALINYEDYFSFEAYKKAIKDAETANIEFGKTVAGVTDRIEKSYKSIIGELKPFVDTLNKFNVSQRGAAQSLVTIGTETEVLIKKQATQKQVIADLTSANNLLTHSITDLKTTQKALETEYNSLGSVEEKDIQRKKQIEGQVKRIVPAIQAQAAALKNAKGAVDAAEGSYRAWANEMKAIEVRLRAMSNAFDPVTGKINKQNKEAVQLSETHKKLSTAIKGADAQMGIFGRNVGNYQSAFKGIGAGIGQVISTIGLLIGIQSSFQAVSFIFNTNKQLDALNYSLRVVTKTQDEFSKSQEFLSRVAYTNGLQLQNLTQSYKLFYAAATETNLTAEQTRTIFEQVSRVVGVLKLSGDDANGVFLALEQMLSKGTVSMEELRRQLGQYIPGAFNIAAKSVGVTTVELNKMIKAGNVASADFLPKFAEQLLKTFGGDINQKIESLQASTQRFNNALQQLVNSDTATNFFESLTDSATDLINSFNDFISIPLEEKLAGEKLELNGIVESIISVNDNQQLRNSLIAELVQKYPDFLAGMQNEIISNDSLSDRLKTVNLLYDQRIENAIRLKSLEGITKEQQGALSDAAKQIEGLRRGALVLGVSTVGFDLSKGKDIISLATKLQQKLNEIEKTDVPKFDKAIDEIKKTLFTTVSPFAERSFTKIGNVASENLKKLEDANKTLSAAQQENSDVKIKQDQVDKQSLVIQEKELIALKDKLKTTQALGNANAKALGIKFTPETDSTLQAMDSAIKLKEKSIDDLKAKLNLLKPEKVNVVGPADDTAAKKAADTGQKLLDQKVKAEEDALKATYELELKQSEQLLAEKRIDEVDYLQTRYNLTKAYVEKASEIERKKGKDTDIAKLSDLRKLEQDALNDFTKARIKKTEEFNQLDIDLQQKQIESETNLAVQALKANQVIEIALKGKTDLEKERLEVDYQNEIDRIVIDGLTRRAALETDIKNKQKFEDDIKVLEQGIRERNKLFSDVTEPNEFYKLGVKYINDQYNLKKELGIATVQDEIDKYNKLIEIAKTYNKNYEELERDRTILIKQQQQQVLEDFRQSTQQLSSLIGAPLTNFFDTLISSFEDVAKGLSFQDSFKEWANTAIAAGNVVNEQFHQASDERIAKLEAEKERELKIAGTNEEAKAAIEAKFAKAIAKEKRKQAIIDKAAALFTIAINTAIALSSPANLATLGALSPLIIALGIAQAAFVAAKPIPEFKTGTRNAPEGPALVDEAGSELIVDKHGQLKEIGTDKGARMTYLKRGDKVITHTETKQILKNVETEKILKETALTHRLSNTIQQGKREEIIYTMAKAMQGNGFNQSHLISAFKEAIKDIPIHQTLIDERGQRERWRRANETITYLNKMGRI